MDDDKINKALATSAPTGDQAQTATRTRSQALQHLVKLYDAEAAAKKAAKEAQAELDEADAQASTASLTEADVHDARTRRQVGTPRSRAESSAKSMR